MNERNQQVPCRCGTGNYCHRHWSYGALTPSKADHDARERLVRQEGGQKCGGGQRVIKKTNKE
jgi:hypothetical protein